jgi:hypothetical protein
VTRTLGVLADSRVVTSRYVPLVRLPIWTGTSVPQSVWRSSQAVDTETEKGNETSEYELRPRIRATRGGIPPA